MNNKNWIKLRIVMWSFVAVLLSIVLIVGINGKDKNVFIENIFTKGFTISNMKVVKTYKFDNIKDIKNIETNLGSSDLTISESNEENIKVIIKSNKKLKNKKYVDANINADTLNIEENNKTTKKIFIIPDGYSLEVEVKVPKSYKENIIINNKTGDISFDSDLDINNLNINIKTGDIEGNQNISTDNLSINSKVGDVEFKFLEGKNINIECKTGNIDIDKFSGSGNLESDIGDISCNIENLNGDFNVKSRIGDIDLDVNKQLSFSLECNKKFGEIDNNLEFNKVSQSSNSFTGEYGNKPENKITVNIKTGDININD